MSERSIREQLPIAGRERREHYRHSVAEALNIARQYNGSEAAYGALMRSLEGLEEGVKGLPFSGDTRAKETEAALTYTEARPHEINELLGTAAESQRRALALENEKHPYVLDHYDGMFLVPGDQPVVLGMGDGEGHYEARFDTIVNDFIDLMKVHGVFADDVIITVGKKPTNMMRQESYVKVEIPRIAKTVLLCNQVGEATFILQGSVPNGVLSKYTKEALQTNALFAARRIVRGQNWQAQLVDFLFNEDAWGEHDRREKLSRMKLDVRDIFSQRVLAITEITGLYTPDRWIRMTEAQKLEFKVKNIDKGMFALSGIFGIDRNPTFNLLAFFQLGLSIWPDSLELQRAVEIEGRTPEIWRKAISEAGHTPEQWAAMTVRQVKSFVIDTKGSVALATVFGTPPEPAASTLNALRLGFAFWPDSAILSRAIEVESRTPQLWRQAFIRAGYTPERWIAMKREEIKTTALDGKGLRALATIFGVPGNPTNNRQDFLRLGLAIWPESLDLQKVV